MPSSKISRKHLVDVVARETKSGLGQIVGAEGKELGFFRNLVRDQRSPGQFDHRAHEIIDLSFLFLEDFLGDAMDDCRLVRHFFQRGGERNHHFGKNFHSIFRHGHGRFEDGAGLHLGDLGIGDSQTTAAMSEHGIEFVQLLHPAQQSS